MISNYYQASFTDEKHKLERSESEIQDRSFEVQRNILILSLAILWNLDLNELPFFSKILMPVVLKCWQLYVAIDNIPRSKWQCQGKEMLVNGDMHLLFKERRKRVVFTFKTLSASSWFVIFFFYCKQSYYIFYQILRLLKWLIIFDKQCFPVLN